MDEPSEQADRYYAPAGSAMARKLFPGIEIRATAGDQIMLSVVHFDADAVVPEHAHPHEQMGMMISGRAEFTIGGVTRTLGPGDIWRIPGHVPHRVRAVDGPAVALGGFHPVRDA